jgi:Adenylate cyclase, family 3 (some proteins contain HAMP domain)
MGLYLCPVEQNLAILIADLSGYTALTETHGAAAAADIIDKFHDMVRRALVGASRLHERVGDEVMIVSEAPGDLMHTAAMLIHLCSAEHQFLQVHGSLHYGPVLKRNEFFFGATLNLASRIAAIAAKGRFWCSADFIRVLPDSSQYVFESKGMHRFKNVRNETELFELQTGSQDFFYIDPICRMVICDKEKAIAHPEEQNIFFCSKQCLEIYNSHK